MIPLSFITLFALLIGAQSYAKRIDVFANPPPSTISKISPFRSPSTLSPKLIDPYYIPGFCDAAGQGLTDPPAVVPTRGNCPFKFLEFTCFRTRESTDPLAGLDVRHLRPEDIKVAMAIGDSMTAGFGLNSRRLPFVPVEYRGKAFSVGADESAYSVFNFLKVYNPDLRGGSTGYTKRYTAGKDLNLAKTGSRGRDLPGQIDKMIEVLNDKIYHDVRNDWKLLTVLIGPNDICTDVCTKGIEDSAESVEKGIREALEKARMGIKKMHVNLVGLFSFAQIYSPQENSPYCRVVRKLIGFCKCQTWKVDVRETMDDAVKEFNRRFAKIADDYQRKNYPDFNVVYQPAFTKLPLAHYDLELLSAFDCFHPNDCAVLAMAFGLWNNMWRGPLDKGDNILPNTKNLVCPDGDKFLR